MLAGDESLGVAAEVDKDPVAVHALDRARDQRHGAVLVFLDDLRPLGLAYLLHDDLLGGLGGDAPEDDRFHRDFDVAAHLGRWIDIHCVIEPELVLGHFQLGRVVSEHLPAPEGLVFTRLAVDRNPHLDVLAVLAAGRRGQRGLERLENDFACDALLVGHRFDDFKDLPVHVP